MSTFSGIMTCPGIKKAMDGGLLIATMVSLILTMVDSDVPYDSVSAVGIRPGPMYSVCVCVCVCVRARARA